MGDDRTLVRNHGSRVQSEASRPFIAGKRPTAHDVAERSARAQAVTRRGRAAEAAGGLLVARQRHAPLSERTCRLSSARRLWWREECGDGNDPSVRSVHDRVGASPRSERASGAEASRPKAASARVSRGVRGAKPLE
jgi:hypothetical protein